MSVQAGNRWPEKEKAMSLTGLRQVIMSLESAQERTSQDAGGERGGSSPVQPSVRRFPWASYEFL